LSSCQLWHNATGTWHKNYTWVSPSTGQQNFTTLQVSEGGLYKYNVWCNDTLNNEVWGLNNLTFGIDITYPLIEFNPNTDANNTWYNRAYLFANVTASDSNINLLRLKINGINYTFTDNVGNHYWETETLADGAYNFTAWVNDTAGNFNETEMREIYLDGTYPQVSITSPTNNTWFSSGVNIQINYTVSDVNINSCWYTNNSGLSNQTITCGQNITINSSDGSYTLIVYTNDSSNNPNSSNIYFSVDSVYPALTLYEPEGLKKSLTVPVKFLATDTNRGSCWINITRIILGTEIAYLSNTILSSCNSNTTYTVSFDDANYRLRFSVNDSANNLNWTSSDFNTDVPTSGGGSGGGAGTTIISITPNITYCGDNLCQEDENFRNCPKDCPGPNFDTLILNCFSSDPELKEKCIWKQASFVFYAGVFIFFLIILSIILSVFKSKKRKLFILQRPLKKKRRGKFRI